MNFLLKIFLATSLSFLAPFIQAQEKTGKSQNIKISPTSFFAHTLLLGYEKAVGKNKSFQLFGGLIAQEKKFYNNLYQKILGGSGELQFRTYLFDPIDKLSGLYAGPYARIRYIKFEERIEYYDFFSGILLIEDLSYTLINYDGGVILGYQANIKDILVFDIFAGGGVRFSESTREDQNKYYVGGNNIFFQHNTGVIPKGGIRIGIFI